MKAKLRALASFSREERGLLARAWISLLWVDIGLRFFSLPQVRSFLAETRHDQQAGDTTSLVRLAHLVDVAARHHVRPVHCLQRALVLTDLLARRGVRAELQIGVLKQEGLLHAHAWLEMAGVPLAESAEVGSLFLALTPAQEIS